MSKSSVQQDATAGRRQARRLALMLGLLAVALYVGFIALTVLRARH